MGYVPFLGVVGVLQGAVSLKEGRLGELLDRPQRISLFLFGEGSGTIEKQLWTGDGGGAPQRAPVSHLH